MSNTILIGNVGADPVLRETSSGHVCNFTLAETKGSGDKARTTWHKITTWHDLAKGCAKEIGKGMRVVVTGDIKNGSYEKDGVKHYTTEIFASDVGKCVTRVRDEGSPVQKPPVDDPDYDLPF